MDEAAHIKKILTERLKKFSYPDDSIKKIVQKEVEDICGISLDKKSIKPQNKILFIKASPQEKSAIFIQKKALLKNLKEKLGGKAPHDIK